MRDELQRCDRGLQNKIEMISRISDGFRYVENYRMRVMTH